MAAAVFAAEASAATLRVPQDYATIQAAVNAAVPGDTVSVSPGVYRERVDNHSKAITIESTAGAASTTIESDDVSGLPVVVLLANPGETPVLRGFTILDGERTNGEGGIYTANGPALIENNRVVDVVSCSGAVTAVRSQATIRNNVVTGTRSSCFDPPLHMGSGIYLNSAGAATITGNEVAGNAAGIYLLTAGSSTVSGNTITGNLNFGIEGTLESHALVVNNVIAHNGSDGVTWDAPMSSTGPTRLDLVNNTIAENGRSAVRLEGFTASMRVANNVVVGAQSSPVFDCPSGPYTTVPIIEFNDVFSRWTGARYGGLCTDRTGVNGNISADPLFAGAEDFHLQPGSPAIDAGTSDGAPALDREETTRPQGPAVDMGAYEAAAVAAAGPIVTGGGRFATGGEGEVLFELSNESVALSRTRGQRFTFAGDVTSVTGSGSTAVLRGTGSWNGTDGHTFDISVADNSGPRRRDDTIDVVIRNPAGDVVFSSGEPRLLKRGDIEVVPAAAMAM